MPLIFQSLWEWGRETNAPRIARTTGEPREGRLARNDRRAGASAGGAVPVPSQEPSEPVPAPPESLLIPVGRLLRPHATSVPTENSERDMTIR